MTTFRWCDLHVLLFVPTTLRCVSSRFTLHPMLLPPSSFLPPPPHHIASHHITSYHITSQGSTHHITAQHFRSHHITSHHASHITPYHTTSHHTFCLLSIECTDFPKEIQSLWSPYFPKPQGPILRIREKPQANLKPLSHFLLVQHRKH